MNTEYIAVTPTHVGICGSDLQKIEAGISLESLGHEIVGVATIEGALQRVAVNPLVSCGKCKYCATDRTMFCRSLKVVGRDISGALSGEMIVPRVNVVILPDDLSDEVAVLADPYAVVAHGVSLLPRILEADNVLIIGDGVIGLLNLVYLVMYGNPAAQYTILAQKSERVSHLAMWAEQWASPDVLSRIRFVTELEVDQIFSVAIEAVGRNQIDTFTTAVHSLEPRGTILSYGVYPPGSTMSVDMRTLMYKEITVLGVNSYNPSDFTNAVNDLLEYRSIVQTIVGDIYPFRNRGDAIKAARDKIERIAKKIVITVEHS